MAEDVLVKFGADVSDFSQQFQTMINSMQTMEGAATSAGSKTTTAFEKAGGAAEDLGETIKNKVGSALDGLASKLVAAFAVERVLAFGNAAVDAFAKSQQSALQLLSAVNGNVAAQGRLLDISKQLSDKFAIPQSAITAQEKFLAVNGRTEDQIKKTIEAAIQLSAVTGEDLGSSVFKLNATFEGNIGRLARLDKGFKDLSKSQLENGAGVDLVLQKYQGFAEKGLEGAEGQMKRNEVAAEELTIRLGERLAPMWLAVKTGALDFASALVDVVAAEDKLKNNVSSLASIYATDKTSSNASLEAEKEHSKVIQSQLEGQRAILQEQARQHVFSLEIPKQLEETNKKIQEQKDIQEAINQTLEKRKSDQDAEQAKAEKQIETLEGLKEKLQDLQKQQEKVVDPLGAGKGQSDDLLAKIKDTQAKIDEITGKAQEKRAKEDKEFADKQSAFLEEMRKKRETAELASITDETEKKKAEAQKQYDDRIAFLEKGLKDGFILQNDFDAEIERAATDKANAIQTIELKKAEETAKKLAEINKKFIEDGTKQNQAAIDVRTATQKANLEKEYQAKGDFSKNAEQKLQKELLAIALQGDIDKQKIILETEAAGSEKYLAAQAKLIEDEDKLRQLGIKNIGKTEIEKRKIIEETLKLAQSIGDQLFNLDKAFTDAKIQALNEQQTTQDQKFTDEQAALDKQHNLKLVSEQAYQAQSANIKQQQVAADKKIAAEIAEVKRKQAIADREKSAFDIIIKTAEAVINYAADPLTAFEVPFIIALGALELGAVLAQPIPKFARGTKGTNASGLAMVGEEGPELAFMPGGTKILPTNKVRTFGEAIDAMYDNRFEHYMNERFVAPALLAYKAKQESQQQENFAKNIAQSLMFNGIDEYGMVRSLNKLNEKLPKLIAQELVKIMPSPKSPYH